MDKDIIDLETKAPVTPAIDVEALQTLLAQLQAQQTTQPKEDSFKRVQDVVDADKSREAMMAEMREQVAFDAQFDGLLDKYKGYFGGYTANQIRAGGHGLSGNEMDHHLKVASFKAFFSNPDNLKLVAPHEVAFVNSELGKNDRLFDSKRAWTVLQGAMFMADQLDYNNSIRGTGGSNGATNTPHIDAFIEKCRARFN